MTKAEQAEMAQLRTAVVMLAETLGPLDVSDWLLLRAPCSALDRIRTALCDPTVVAELARRKRDA